MDFTCPLCSQPLSIADEELAALRGRATIPCPACGGKITLPKPKGAPPQHPPGFSPIRAPGQLKPPPRPPVPAAPAKAAKPAKPKKPRAPIDPAKVQRNLLILGSAALLTLGGIAGFLATREAGKVVKIDQKIVNKLIQNEYFQRLIRDGKTTEAELAKVEDAYAYGKGFIGVSREVYTWADAQALARTTASAVLDVTTHARQSREELGGWIAEKIPALKNQPVWVRHLTDQALMDAPDLLNQSADRPHRVLLAWPVAEPWPNQGWSWALKADFEDVEAFDASTGLARAKSGGLWGLIDKKGFWVLKPGYDKIEPFTSHQSAKTYREGSGHGLVDHTGREVAQPVYADVQELIHGLVPVLKGGKWGYLDSTGKQVVPNEWDDAWRFSSLGYAVVIRDGKRGLLDRSGKLVMPPQWDGFFNFAPEGIGAVRMGRKWWLISPHGLLTSVDHDLDWLKRTLDLGLIKVKLSDGKSSMLNTEGKPATGFEGAAFVEAITSPRGPLMRVDWPDKTQSLQEADGRVLFRTQAKGVIDSFGKDGLAYVQDERGAAFMDALGRLSAPFSKDLKRPAAPAYYGSQPRPYYGRVGNRYGYGSYFGELPPDWTTKTVKSTYTPTSPFWHRFVREMPGYLRGTHDLLSKNGAIVVAGLNPKHQILDDLVPYATPPKYGLIDTTGKVIVEPAWDELRVLSKDWLLIREGHRYGLADSAGKVVVKPAWDDIQVPFVSFVTLAEDGKTVKLGTEGKRFRAPWIIAHEDGVRTVLLPDGKPALPAKLEGATTEYVDFYGPDRLVIRLKEATGATVMAIYEPRTGGLVRFLDATTFIWNWNSAEAGMIWMKDAKATTPLWKLMTREGRALGYTRAEEPWGWGFVEGRALLPTTAGYVFLDPKGQVIGDGSPWQEARDFSEGLAAVKRDGKWGFIDLTGNLVIQPVWKEVRDFHHGRAAALGMDTAFWGYLAKDGTLALAALWTQAEDFTEWTVNGTGESLSTTSAYSWFDRRERRWRLSSGQPWKGVTTDRRQDGVPRTRPVAFVQSGQAWTLLDVEGLPMADPVTDGAPPSNFWLKEDAGGRTSLVKKVLPVEKNSTLRWLTPTTAWVRQGRSAQWTLHDQDGRQLNTTAWAMPRAGGELEDHARGHVVAEDAKGRQALLEPGGLLVLPARYERISWVAPGVAVAWAGREGGLVDAQGKWLFKDDAARRIARFGSQQESETPMELRHGFIVIEDVPRWGYARLNRP